LERHFALNHFQVFLEIGAQRLANSPTTNADAPVGSNWLAILVEIKVDVHYFLLFHFLYICQG
jgi:hypothetical protein